MIRQSIRVFLAVLILTLGCTEKTPPGPDRLSTARFSSQQLIELPFDQRPNTRVDVDRSNRYNEPLDEDSVEMFFYRGANYYQPVNICQACHIFIATYVKTGERRYLDRAERYIAKLLSICHSDDSLLWAPYQMTFAVHGDSANKLSPPWFSGMAQGEMLTVLSRLYGLTGKPSYLQSARQVFTTLTIPEGESDRWVVRLDSADYYWIEEYPDDDLPAQTLNGFITAVQGVYEYYLASKDPRARRIYDLSLTTLEKYVPEYRRPGENSLYCLGHRFPATDAYHALHVRLLDELYRISGNSFFHEQSEMFRNDPKSAE